MKVTAISERHVLIQVGDDISIKRYFLLDELVSNIKSHFGNRILNTIISYTSVQVEVENSLELRDEISDFVNRMEGEYHHPDILECIEIPVCYEETFALDRLEVMQSTGLNWDEIVKRHTSPYYLTFFLGFALGFPYLAGMDPSLKTPRKETPRIKIEKGSVGIANEQTGLYTVNSPGGWQIIGKSPVDFYDINEGTTVLSPGLIVKFKAISEEEYNSFSSGKLELKRSNIPWPFK